jgi:nicotinate-nucleotide--dimethylbenzimidazole phosphoribosyltransferase
MLIEKTITEIKPLSAAWYEKAWARLDNLSKPRRSLGVLEEMAARVVAIRESERPQLDKKAVFVFAGDHGVVAEGVSAYPQEVTGAMVGNFLAGGAGINVLARKAGADVGVIDIGMKEDMKDAKGLIRKNVKRGTDNMATGPAMTVEEARRAINVGIETAFAAYEQGNRMIATGEMGIGNTTPSSALFSMLLPCSIEDVTDKGTGLDNDSVRKKAKVIERAIEKNREIITDPISTLAAVGGLEIAGICGLCLGGAARRMVVVVDGFISSAGALVAMRLCPEVKEYLFFSHMSQEKGHRIFFEKEKLRPVLYLDMRLGEGTGAAIAMQIVEVALSIHNEMATFDDINVEPGA